MIMDSRWISLLFLVFIAKTTWSSTIAPCRSVDSLYVGCYNESSSDREFLVSAGNYNSSELYPGMCVGLCGYLSFRYSALQNGNYCLCGNTFGRYGALNTCNISCPADAKKLCGGKMANSVYNSSGLIGVFNITQPDKPFVLFNKANLTISCTDCASGSPGIAVDDGQGTGFSAFSSENAKFSYQTTKWGTKTIRARNSFAKDFNTLQTKVKITAVVKHLKIDCPSYVKIGEQFPCKVLVYQGIDMMAEWKFAEGTSGNLSLSDPVYQGVGPSVPQWSLTNISSLHGSGLFLIPSSIFMNDAVVLGVEIYGHTTGTVTIFVARPRCLVENQTYCINNGTCISSSQSCPAMFTRQQCTSPETLSLSTSSCQNPAFCNRTLAAPVMYRSAVSSINYTVVCMIQAITIKTGYNLYVLPDDKVCHARKGDMLGWGIDGSGRIAHYNDNSKKTLKYTGISLPLSIGQNITHDSPSTEIPVEYLMKAVGAEGSTFKAQHTINKEGSDYFHVHVANNMASLPVTSVREIRAQQPLSWISGAYLKGFSYFGTRKNAPVELIMNVSSATNVTVICKNITSGELLFNLVNVQDKAGGFFLSKANHSFNLEGLYQLYVEASNEISSVNTTINVLVAGDINDLKANLTQPDQPVYMGLQTGLVAASASSNLRFKWRIGKDDTGFLDSNTTTYNFKQEGLNRVTLYASNLAFTSNVSFTVKVMNPLWITSPEWNATSKPITFRCGLKGAFSAPQNYIWSFGDGSKRNGSDLTSVQHTYTKGSHYNVSCRIQNEAPVISTKTIFILEPVTGDCLKALDGVRLGDNKTFVAQYSTGNNLTFDWTLQGSTFAMLAICPDKYFTYHFKKPGGYNLTVKISNAISSLKCYQTFFVDEKIANISIKAYPNPAPSNSTVRFEISKRNGTNVTYEIDFGDGNFVKKFDGPQWEYNRTFNAKKWQIILTANNSVSREIVFYSLTVQDVVKNVSLSVTVDQDGGKFGKPYVAVGKTKTLRCQADQGTDVFFTWRIEGNEYKDKGQLQKTGESVVHRRQTFNDEKEIKIYVYAYNLVSSAIHCLTIVVQQQIEGFVVDAPKGVSLNQEFIVNFRQNKGSNVDYTIRFDDGSSDIKTKNSYVKKSFSSQKEFTVHVWATNQVTNISVSRKIAVQTKIEGMMVWLSKAVAAVNEPITVFWNITKGSDVTFFIDFNDGSVNQTNGTSHPVGKMFNLSHSFNAVKTYLVTVTAKNYLEENQQKEEKLQIEQPIKGLTVKGLTPKLTVFETVTVEADVDKGSNVQFTFDFGDSLGIVKPKTGKVTYKYRYPRKYNVTITASNLISSKPLIKYVEVTSSAEEQQIQGLKVIAHATRFGEKTKIQIISEGGTGYSCKVKGIELEENLDYARLKEPLLHEFPKVGKYEITVVCENKRGSRTASVTTTVEEPIEGLHFTEKYQSKQFDFGSSHEFKWSWTKGSHVRCTTDILSKEEIVKTIHEECKTTIFLPGYVKDPGMYTLRIVVRNSVTPTLRISTDIILVENITEVQLKVNPYVQIDFPVMMFLDMKTGTHATSVWMYGNGAEIVRTKSVSDRFISSMRRFKTPGVHTIKVVVWNCFSSNSTASATVTIMNPVTGFEVVSPLVQKSKTVQFQFSRTNDTAAPTNASFEFDFGDGLKSQAFPLSSSQLVFKHSHDYKAPGCYTAKLRIFNKASDAKFKILVKIEEKIENITLRAVHSDQSSSPGRRGYGKHGNLFAREYPVRLNISHDKGTCVKYQWFFGDNQTVTSDSIATDHHYALPGNYTIRVEAWNNKGGKVNTSLNIGIRWSIVGLYVVSSSPSKPGQKVTFIIFCAQTGNNSNFVLDTGDNQNKTIKFTSKGNGYNEMTKYISSEVKLPFNASSYYSVVADHTYLMKGVYEARVYAWNEVSRKTVKTNVVITDKNCKVPGLLLYGGGDTIETASKIKYGREFRIDSRANISCVGDDGKTVEAKFEWGVFKADVLYLKDASGPPDEGRKINNLPNDVIFNRSFIAISSLEPGYYLLQLTVNLSSVGLTNSLQRYIQVMTPNVVASIKGGSARSRGWEVDIELDASESYDPLKKNLKFEWRCALAKHTPNKYVFGKGGCFGNGNNLVESEEPIFKIRSRRLLESVTYSFNVTVTPSDDKKRAGHFTQDIEIVQGKPPDINIKCVHNCAKKVTTEEQLTLEAYCADCNDNYTELEFLWSAVNVTSGKEVKLWPSETLTSKTLQYVVVKKKAFLQDKEYMLKVKAKRKGGVSAFAQFKFQTNSPPRDGKCKFAADKIEELQTLAVSCENWKEDDTPLSYEVLLKKEDDFLLLWYGPELRDCKVILEAGKKVNNFTVQLIARVKDVYGAVTDTTHNIKVERLSNIDTKVFEDSANAMSNLLASGDDIGAIQLTSALGSIVNERAGNLATEDKEKIRSRLVREMTKVDPSNLQAVRLLTGSLEAVTKQTEEIDVQAQVDSTNIYSRAVDVVSRSAERKGIEPDQIELASKTTFSAICNALVASATSSKRIFDEDKSASDLEKTKSSSSRLVEMTNTLAKATLNIKVPGENATKYEANQQTLTVKKIRKEDLEKAGIEGFSLPGKDVLLDGLDGGHKHLGLMVSKMPLNPFGGTNSSKMINSETMSLVISGNNSKELKIKGLSSYIDIFLKNEKLGQNETVNVTRSRTNVTRSRTNMTVHKISNVRVNMSIFVDIIPQNRSIPLNIYLKYSDHPSRDNYDLMTSLPHFDVNQTVNITSPGPFTFHVPSEHVNVSGDYYIGVSFVLNDTSTFHNYTFDPFVAGCYYWDGQRGMWTCDGCKVGNKTSREVTHCQCTHLTWFGGDLFIPPNKLDVKQAIKNLKNLDKSWPLLITIGVVGGLYILAMVWARRQDRKDLTKVGLIVVPDSDPTDRFRYEVTVYTGRMARGTTSNISMILYGDLNESHPIALKDKNKPIFESGSVDSFLVTVPVALGSLNYLRIWHDNSGIWPAWYLNQVIIRDIDTDERFVFLCYRWFACDEDDGQVVRLVPVAGREDLREFTYLFKNRAKKDFTDAHLWFSIALRPPRSVFTRVQRISCCFSLLLCTMLTNVMWYGREKGTPQNDTVIFKSGFIVITWREILIGIQASLIVFPINLLIVQIFRNTERKPKKKKKPEQAIKLESTKSKNDQILTLSDIHAVPRSEASQGNIMDTTRQDKPLKKMSLVKKVQKKSLVSRQDLFEEDLLSLLRETRMLEEPQMGKSLHSLEKLSDKDSVDLDPVDIVKEQPAEMRRQQSISPVSNSSFDWANDKSKLMKPSAEQNVKIKVPKIKFLFPWWFVYIGWFLCFATSAASAFFTILYGNEMKVKTQQQWLVSMFFSIVQDIFISQPLKVIGFAMFFALIWKKPEKEDNALTAELAKDEEWLKENVGGRRRNALIAHRPKFLPPDEIMLKKARIRRFKERKMFSVIREIAFYAMFVWVVLVIAYGHKDPNSEVLNQGIENMLTGKGNSWLVDYTMTKARNGTLRKFLKVSGVNKYWNWTKTILLPSLYNGPWYNGDKDDPGFMADRTSWVVGVARIRQLRVKTDTCEVSNVFEGSLKECNEPYSWTSEDTTTQFRPGWLPALPNYTTPNQAWTYRTGTALKSLPFLGRLAFYSGGGYSEDLGPSLEVTQRKIEDMEANNWIDKLTRAVFVEVTIYNSNTNLYCVIFLVLEVSASGGTFPFVELLITRIDRYAGSFMIFVLIFELAFVVFVIFFTYKLFKGALKLGPRYYFKKYWSWVELALVSLCWTSIALYFVRFGLNSLTQTNYRETPKEFVNFHHLAISDQLFGYVYAFVVFLVSLKFLRLFRFNRRMSLLASTLRNASKELWCFSLVFSIVFMAFVHFCYLVFSNDLYMFHTVMSTAETLISVMLGKFSYERLLQTNRILAPLMFFCYSLVVVFVLINMFISIIIENFQAVKRNNDLQSNEYEIVDFMMDQFKIWLGWSSWGVIFSKNKVGSYPMGKPKYKKPKRETETDKLNDRVDRLIELIQEVYFDNSDFVINDAGGVTLRVSSPTTGESNA